MLIFNDMKKLLHQSQVLITGVLFVVFMTVSCDLDKYPLDGPAVGSFPSNEEEAIMGLLGAYQSISTLDASSTPIWQVMDNITDVGYARPGNNYTSPITSSLTTDNALANKPWQYYYRTIARVHSVLDNLPNIQTEIQADQYNQIDAELRFIRAYSYSQLIELYGNVPLLKQSVGLIDADVPRTDKKKIQEFIINELDEVSEYLPLSHSQHGKSRATRVAAFMLQARVALYSQNYDLAVRASKKAIELSEGVHELTSFNNSIDLSGQKHDQGEPDVSNVFGHAGFSESKEWIWIAEYSESTKNTHNKQYYAASRLGKGVCYWGPTQNFIDSFQAIDGLPIDKSSLYNADKPFENRDPRLDLYCVRPHSRFMGYQFEPNKSFSTVANYWPVIEGSAQSPSQITNTDATNAYRSFSGYLWRKHVDIADYPSTSVSGVSELGVGIFRFAELLLLYAEAKIENNDIDESVYEAINKVRNRAHMPSLEGGLSQNELRATLRYERKIELANDGLRWFDLRRWGIAKEVMNGYLYLNRAGNNWSADVIVKIDENSTPIYNEEKAKDFFTTQEVVYQEGKDEYWPVPFSEMNANPNLEQNPGY